MRLSRSFVVTAALGAVAMFGLMSPASAERCDVHGDIFYMHDNDAKKTTIQTDQHGCDLHFVTRGKTRFRSARIVAKPQNGLLRKIANVEFRYKPRPDFKGTDTFTLRVCGRTEKGRGCSTITYQTFVN